MRLHRGVYKTLLASIQVILAVLLLPSCQIAVDYKLPTELSSFLPPGIGGGGGGGVVTPQTKISIGENVKDISVGREHVCVLLISGNVKCWGRNGAGQLGYDDTVDRGTMAGSMEALPVVNLGAGRTAKALSVGYGFTCVILDTGDVKCWGDNWRGELGQDDFTNRGNTPGSMAALNPINIGAGRIAKAIATGYDHVCVILDTDDLKCWGSGADGELGSGDTNDRGGTAGDMAALGAVILGAGRKAKAVSAGAYNTCVIMDNNQLKCFGYNWDGQLGLESRHDDRGTTVPAMNALPTVNLGAGRIAKSVSIYEMHTCAILDTDEVKCWGDGSVGETGHDNWNSYGDTVGSMATLPVTNLGVGRTAKSIATGFEHTCAILDDDTVKCWGDNSWGELGYNDMTERGSSAGSMAAIVPVNLGVGRTAKKIALGGFSSCALMDTDEVKCWGWGDYGKLGQNNTAWAGNVDHSVATMNPVNLSSTSTAIASGNGFSCALLSTGNVKCWGANGFGQLGYDDTTSRGQGAADMTSLSNVNLGAGRTAKAIAAGSGHACVILDTDQVKCWGSNSSGQLGYDSTANMGATAGSMALLAVVNIGAGRIAKSIYARAGSTCVILDTDDVKCWGNNSNGQLGYDSTTNKGDTAGSMAALGNVNVGAGRKAKSLAMGDGHTCALLDTNQVKCWGWNWWGSLGYDNTTDQGKTVGSMAALGTVNLGVGRTAKVLAAGGYHTCAILDNDDLKCWGQEQNGDLGYDQERGIGATPGSFAGSMNALGAVNLGAGRSAISLSLGLFHTCAILDNNQMKCWGNNYHGELGQNGETIYGNATGSMAALPQINFGSSTSVKAVATGYTHNCVITNADEVKCFGANYSGELGGGNTVWYGQGITMEDLLPIGE